MSEYKFKSKKVWLTKKSYTTTTKREKMSDSSSLTGAAVGSANHFLAMLNGDEVHQQVYALKKLDLIVDY